MLVFFHSIASLEFALENFFFPKQFTVGVLNATLDLAALVLVSVVGFLGFEVVLRPVVSHCLRLSPFMWGVSVGWYGAASTTKIFRNQNQRFQSKCKLFGVYAGVILLDWISGAISDLRISLLLTCPL